MSENTEERRKQERRNGYPPIQYGAIIVALGGSAISFVGSILFVVNMLMSPIEAQIEHINLKTENINQRIVDIVQRVGMKGRSNADILRLYEITSRLNSDMEKCEMLYLKGMKL